MANLTLKLLLAGLRLGGRKKGMAELFRLTATAFGRETPDLHGQSHDKILDGYARFTRSEADKAMQNGTAPILRKSLYEHALILGRDIRAKLPIRSRADAAAALTSLYGLLAIDMTVDCRGMVTIQRCSCSSHYTPEVCRFMSAMDEGIVSGLCSGRLTFSQRLTEGADHCRGRIEWPDGQHE